MGRDCLWFVDEIFEALQIASPCTNAVLQWFTGVPSSKFCAQSWRMHVSLCIVTELATVYEHNRTIVTVAYCHIHYDVVGSPAVSHTPQISSVCNITFQPSESDRVLILF